METLSTVLGLQRQTSTENKLTPEADNWTSAHPAQDALHFALTSEQSRAATPPLTFFGGLAPRN
jgi:hypothetical protein